MASEEQKGGPTAEDLERIADTNLEGIGSPEHRELRRKAAMGERAWDGISLTEEGVRVWRIEKFNVVNWAQKLGTNAPADAATENYGTFFGGDSFIVLNGYRPDPDEEKLLFNIHFWLGENTTQDEAGTAAYKTVELDDLLRDLPVQYREVQGHETKGFTDLFPNLNLLSGGVDSGFRHVEPTTYRPRLLHVHGKKKRVRTKEVPLAAASVNSTDCFVLDLGETAITFRGPNASAWEKRAAGAKMEEIFNMRSGRVRKENVEWDDTSGPADLFWETLGGKPATLPDTAGFKTKKQAEEKAYQDHVNKVVHVTDETGEMVVEEKQSGVLDRAILAEEPDDVLIVDVGRVIYVWLGPSCNGAEKKEAMVRAQNFLFSSGRPVHTPIIRVSGGMEPANFWKCFGCEHVPADIC